MGTVWVVGGAVRDALLGLQVSTADLDIVVEQDAMDVARRVANRLGWAYYAMDPVRDVARLVFSTGADKDLHCDISGMRGSTIEDDLSTRDFTINAMAIRIDSSGAHELVDIYGGQDDLKRLILRRVGPLSLSEDQIRLIRAPRLMVQFGLEIDGATRIQLERLADSIRLASRERVRDELWRLFACADPSEGVELLAEFRLLHPVLPEVTATWSVEQTAPHELDVYHHTLAVVRWTALIRDCMLGREVATMSPASEQLFGMLSEFTYPLRRYFSQTTAANRTRADWLVWYALLHDVGKPATETVEWKTDPETGTETKRIRFLRHETQGAALVAFRLNEYRFSRHEVARGAAVVQNHMRLHNLHSSFMDEEISRRATYRFFRDIGDRQTDRLLGIDVIILSLADYLGTVHNLDDDWTVYLAHASQLLRDALAPVKESSTHMQPVLNGNQLMSKLKISPGPLVGVILEQVLEAQAAGEISSEQEALQFAARIASEQLPSN